MTSNANHAPSSGLPWLIETLIFWVRGSSSFSHVLYWYFLALGSGIPFVTWILSPFTSATVGFYLPRNWLNLNYVHLTSTAVNKCSCQGPGHKSHFFATFRCDSTAPPLWELDQYIPKNNHFLSCLILRNGCVFNEN